MKGMSSLVIVSLVLAALVIYVLLNAQQESPQCTLEAKLCPDGSAVGRTGPNCEFAPCPGGQTYCSPESRNADACAEIYQPVCGWFGQDVQCVVYPCATAFSNSCEACMNPTVEYYTPGECPTVQTQIANPASTFCIENRGKLEMKENENGQYGICTLPNGTQCEEWAFFRGECGK